MVYDDIWYMVYAGIWYMVYGYVSNHNAALGEISPRFSPQPVFLGQTLVRLDAEGKASFSSYEL